MASLISTRENRVFYEGKLFPKRIYCRIELENSENWPFLKAMVSFLGSILTSPLKKTRQVMAVMKKSNFLMLLKMWLFWLNSTIKVTFLECPCCWWCFWSESGWMSQWEMCLDWARDEGKAKGNAWLFQVWQIYMLTKKVEYDQQHVGKYYKEDWESVLYKYTHDQQTDFQIHWDCGSWADCEKYEGQSQQTYRPFWQR